MNIVLQISYDGTPYFGWQKTKEGPSIEETLEKALAKLLGHRPALQAASRTDRGVHARGQVVNFFTDTLPFPLTKLPYALNSQLPHSIRVKSAKVVEESFHPTLDATGKTYLYQIDNAPVASPFLRHTHWHLYEPLDWTAMQKAAPALVGTHNFAALTNERRDDMTRCITAIVVEEGRITVSGTSFLYKMVRNIVGTLVDIGRGRLEDLPAILASCDRTRAGVTAPAHGLTLEKVCYRVPVGVK